MKWRGRRTSSNIEDRRGGRRPGVKRASGGLGMGALILLGASIFFPDAVPLLQMFGIGGQGSSASSYRQDAPTVRTGVNDDQKQFVGVVLGDTEEVWSQLFAESGAIHEERTNDYPEPTLVIFDGRTASPCGPASTGSGPFYCPADKKIYIDPGFYEIMDKRLGASGDFAQAYVVAHEVAHHVQNVTGRIPQVDAYRRRVSKTEANQATVRLELQADCYSGVWTNKVRSVLEEGDIKEALNAAFQIGDDTLQGRNGGHVNPASFTHGTSEQRVNWFFKGLKSGDLKSCDTFSQAYSAL